MNMNIPCTGPAPDDTDSDNDYYTREKLIKSVCEAVGRSDGGKRHPLRVVIIGKHGSGKSSFINSIAAALSGEWHEHAYAGFPDAAGTVTVHVLRYPKCCLENDKQYSNVLLPTLIDVPGLVEDVDNNIEELLRLLLYGHIEEDNALGSIYEEIRGMERREIQEKYNQVYEHMKVDRLVVVASAEEKIPERLLQCALRVARPQHRRENTRSVPVFGVLTKLDKVDTTTTSFEGKQKDFMKLLGLNATRFLLCKNYCDDTQPSIRGKRRGGDDEIDLPILDFMRMLCDTALKVIKDDECLNVTGAARPKTLEVKGQTTAGPKYQIPQVVQTIWASFNNLHYSVPNLILSLTAGVFVWIVLYNTFQSMNEGRAAMVANVCQRKDSNDPDMRAICALPAASFPFLVVTFMSLLFALFVYALGNSQ